MRSGVPGESREPSPPPVALSRQAAATVDTAAPQIGRPKTRLEVRAVEPDPRASRAPAGTYRYGLPRATECNTSPSAPWCWRHTATTEGRHDWYVFARRRAARAGVESTAAWGAVRAATS